MCLQWGRREAGTSEASNGPGIEDDVLGLEAQAVDGKLNHHIHGVGLALWERHPLEKEGPKQEGSAPQVNWPAAHTPLEWTLPVLLCNREQIKEKGGG